MMDFMEFIEMLEVNGLTLDDDGDIVEKDEEDE